MPTLCIKLLLIFISFHESNNVKNIQQSRLVEKFSYDNREKESIKINKLDDPGYTDYIINPMFLFIFAKFTLSTFFL